MSMHILKMKDGQKTNLVAIIITAGCIIVYITMYVGGIADRIGPLEASYCRAHPEAAELPAPGLNSGQTINENLKRQPAQK